MIEHSLFMEADHSMVDALILFLKEKNIDNIKVKLLDTESSSFYMIDNEFAVVIITIIGAIKPFFDLLKSFQNDKLDSMSKKSFKFKNGKKEIELNGFSNEELNKITSLIILDEKNDEN